MIKLMAAVICAATLITSKATAQETSAEPAFTGSENAVMVTPETDRVAIKAALMCKVRNECGALTDEDRARAAMALLFLRISENCSRKPCALRLARAP